MPNKQLFNSLHIKLYEAIINGNFNPTNTRYSNTEVLKGLLEEAGTIKITTLNEGDDINDYIEKLDYKAIGFKSSQDFDIDVRPNNKGKKDIYAKPLKVYQLMEIMDIPYYNSFKCTTFLELIGDEFERIKIRAERILDLSEDINLTRIYASKHIQKSKKLFYDCKKLLRIVKKNGYPEDIYIVFTLNLFIIRTIMFYQKLFRPFADGNIDKEEQLFSETIHEITLNKLCSLYNTQDTAYCEYIKKSYVEKTVVSEPDASETVNSKEKDFFIKKSLQAGKGEKEYSPLKWHGQINVLVDVLTQLTEETKLNGIPILETTNDNLLNFILSNFRDSNNKELSYYTISTLLKKSRIDKRLHPESPKRINVSKTAKRKK